MKTLSISPIKAAFLAASATALLLTTGCAAPQPAAVSSASASASPSPSASTASSASSDAAAPAGGSVVAAEDPYGDLLITPSPGYVKAGDLVPITGGTLPPGTTVTVYGAQPMAMPSYDKENDMYHQVGEQVIITEKVTAVTDAEGKYNLKLPLAAGLGPQTIHVIAESSAPSGSGGTAALRMIFIE